VRARIPLTARPGDAPRDPMECTLDEDSLDFGFNPRERHE